MRIEQLVTDVLNLPTNDKIGKGLKGIMVGIAYSLKKADELGFVSRPADRLGPDYIEELEDAGAALRGTQEPPRQWLAGFFFNSALVRIAAGAHRALRILLQTDEGKFHDLANHAESKNVVEKNEIDLLREVYKDVNAFKHGRDELFKKRKSILWPRLMRLQGNS